jgi:hypothetical protein
MVEWRAWCGGQMLGGYVDGRVRAGISGPHPNGRWALTFYDGALERRRELLLMSREKAQRVAERVRGLWDAARQAP